MTLQEALNKAVKEFGKDVLIEPRLPNILNDYHGFDEMPAARIILKTMQSDCCISQIVGDVDLSKTQISRIARRLNRLFGFDLALVEQIINDLCFAKCSCNINISTEVTDEDLVNGVKDEYGAIYSKDGKRLLKGIDIQSYQIRSGTQVVCNEAFKYCQSLISIIISDTVTHIGEWAFNWCNGLASINIPDSVTHIGKAAFSDCMGLTSIIIPDSVAHIGKAAFLECRALREITIHNSVTYIGEGVLNECEHLTSIIIPNGSKQRFQNILNAYSDKLIEQDDWERPLSSRVTKEDLEYGIKDEFGALYSPDGKRRLLKGVKTTSYIIKPGTLVICDRAFLGYLDLKGITIPNSITQIGEAAFSCCNALTNITIPNSVTHISNSAFELCTGLTSITIPKTVAYIGKRAFLYCSCLTSITIPNSVTYIGDEAFYGCFGLTSITIPASVTHIGDGLVRFCTGLTSIHVSADNQIYDSRENCNAVIHTTTNTLVSGCKNTIIPNSVTCIADYAFSFCQGLTNITIPNSVTHIGNDAFQGCKAMVKIHITKSIKTIGNNAFEHCDSLKFIYIPYGTLQHFKKLLPPSLHSLLRQVYPPLKDYEFHFDN